MSWYYLILPAIFPYAIVYFPYISGTALVITCDAVPCCAWCCFGQVRLCANSTTNSLRVVERIRCWVPTGFAVFACEGAKENAHVWAIHEVFWHGVFEPAVRYKVPSDLCLWFGLERVDEFLQAGSGMVQGDFKTHVDAWQLIMHGDALIMMHGSWNWATFWPSVAETLRFCWGHRCEIMWGVQDKLQRGLLFWQTMKGKSEPERVTLATRRDTRSSHTLSLLSLTLSQYTYNYIYIILYIYIYITLLYTICIYMIILVLLSWSLLLLLF